MAMVSVGMAESGSAVEMREWLFSCRPLGSYEKNDGFSAKDTLVRFDQEPWFGSKVWLPL